MLKLEYTGEQIVVSPSGVSFLKGKDDKYVYIPSAYKLFKLLVDNANWHGDKLAFDYPQAMPKDKEMLEGILAGDPSVEKRVEKRIALEEQRVEEDIAFAEGNKELDPRERDAYIANLKAMRNYRVQRACNKALYHALIDRIVKIIHDKEIDFVDVPPTRNFMRVLESIRNGLIGKKVSGRVFITCETKHDLPILRLDTYGKGAAVDARVF